MEEKPKCRLSGEDGNIFFVAARARTALKQAGQAEAAEKMSRRVMESKSYDEARRVILEFVDDDCVS